MLQSNVNTNLKSMIKNFSECIHSKSFQYIDVFFSDYEILPKNNIFTIGTSYIIKLFNRNNVSH